MNHKILGLLGLIGAPTLGVGMYLESIHHPLASSWFVKTWGLLYISGWLSSMEGLRRLEATGSDRFGKTIIRVVLVTLCLANVYNVWEMIDPKSTSILYFIVDMNWPLSNLLMVAVGIAVLRARRLYGWQRWIPLFMGFWLPLAFSLSKLVGLTSSVMLISGAYSALAWSLLAITVLTTRVTEPRASGLSNLFGS
ncbi:hypothetical protein [Spirosoma migulaei]